jgi:hypothetical protein
MVPNEFQAFYPLSLPVPTLSPAREFRSPPIGSNGGDTRAGDGVGRLESDDGTDTLLFWLYYDPSTLPTFPTRLSLWQVTYCLCVMPVKELDRRLYQSVGFKFFIQPSKDTV